jgi:hypothetical protein
MQEARPEKFAIMAAASQRLSSGFMTNMKSLGLNLAEANAIWCMATIVVVPQVSQITAPDEALGEFAEWLGNIKKNRAPS